LGDLEVGPIDCDQTVIAHVTFKAPVEVDLGGGAAEGGGA
jgi:hypothetical protein